MAVDLFAHQATQMIDIEPDVTTIQIDTATGSSAESPLDVTAHTTIHERVAHDHLGMAAKGRVCKDCGKLFQKSSAYNDHVTENCTTRPTKNMKCPVCYNSYTYNGLRKHLNYFATGTHRAVGDHAKFTPYQHKQMLEQHKMSKNNQ